MNNYEQKNTNMRKNEHEMVQFGGLKFGTKKVFYGKQTQFNNYKIAISQAITMN